VSTVRLWLAGTLSVGALVLAGCGGSNADASKVRQTVREALLAIANSNGAGFCALATPSGQAQLTGALPGDTCAQVVDRISGDLSTTVKLALQNARVGTVTVHGGHASILASQITSTQGSLVGFLQLSGPPTKLSKQTDGSWKISG
jgi:hypothetical protein